MATRVTIRNRLRRAMRDTELPRWSDDEINDAINFAIRNAWPDWYVVKQDTTNTTATNTFIYTLPTDCKWAAQVWLEQNSNEPYYSLTHWRQTRSTSSTGTITYYLYLALANTYQSGKTIKVIYEAEPPELSNDTDNTNVPIDFIMCEAKSELLETDMYSAPAHDVDSIKLQMQWNKQKAEDIRLRKGMQHITAHVHMETTEGTLDILAIPGIIDRWRAMP